MKNLLYAAPALVPPDPIEIIEALETARTLVGPHLPKGNAIERIGNWGCFCIVAAITAASRTKQIRDAALAAARYALPGRFHGHSIVEYNDHPSTTVDDAKTLLQRAKGLVGTVAA